MTSIVELFPKCRKLAYDARQRLAQTQTGSSPASELYLVLEELHHQLDQMEDLCLRETPAQRSVWQAKIAELRQESVSLQQQGAAATRNVVTGGMTNSSTYQNEHDELMLRRRRKQRNPDAENDLQNLTGEAESLSQSNTMVLDLLATGEASYADLREQRRRLHGVTRVVFDIGNALGLSQAVMRIIERRDITDAYLVAAGMVVTLLVLYLTWFHFD